MALATVDDVSAALGREVAESDVATLLETASDLVNGYLRWTVPDPVPEPVVRVVADMVAAVLTRPEALTADYDASGYNQVREAASVRVGIEQATSFGPWLTKSLKQRLAAYRSGGGVSVSMVSDRTALS